MPPPSSSASAPPSSTPPSQPPSQPPTPAAAHYAHPGLALAPTPLPKVTRAWYAVCESRALRADATTPLSRKLFGLPVVLFRARADRSPVAFLDRCPHRNAPLSLGRVGPAGLTCGYHGWRFGKDGGCNHIPALVDEPVGKARQAVRFACCEHQGYVWIWGEPNETPPDDAVPFTDPLINATGTVTVRTHAVFKATLLNTAENILDVPHTAFLHGGLFRRAPAADAPPQQVDIIRDTHSAVAHYRDEKPPSGLLGWLLTPRGSRLLHQDRFVLPSIAQVVYQLGTRHVHITNRLTPVDDFETHLYTTTCLRLPLGRLLSLLFRPIAAQIVAQDARMLAAQTEVLQGLGGVAFVSTEVDGLAPHMQRLLRQAERGEVSAWTSRDESTAHDGPPMHTTSVLMRV